MKKVLIVAALATVLALAVTGVAVAAQTTPTGPGTKTGTRVEKAKQRIANMIDRLEKTKAKALDRFKKVDERLKQAIDKLKSQGKDTSKISADRDVILSMVKTAEQDFDAAISKLKEADGLAAQSTIEQFKAALKEAKELGKRVRTDVKEIRKYIRTVLIPQIKPAAGKGAPNQNQNQNQNNNGQLAPITL
jgi:DNA repair exonuclease SbcCD ATPase subunit